MTWLELSRLVAGDRVVFTTSWDIYPVLVVPAGTTATIIEQGLNELQPLLFVRPDDAAMRAALAEWDGLIHLNPDVGGADETFDSEAPVTEASST